MINERLKDKTETVKKDRAPDADKPLPVTMSRPRGPACKGGPFVLLWKARLCGPPVRCLHLCTSRSIFFKGEAHLVEPSEARRVSQWQSLPLELSRLLNKLLN